MDWTESEDFICIISLRMGSPSPTAPNRVMGGGFSQPRYDDRYGDGGYTGR